MFTPDTSIDFTSPHFLSLFRRHNIDFNTLSKIGRNTYSVSSLTSHFVLKTCLDTNQYTSIPPALNLAHRHLSEFFDVPSIVDSVNHNSCRSILMTFVEGRQLSQDTFSQAFKCFTNTHPFLTSSLSFLPDAGHLPTPTDHFFHRMSFQIIHLLESNPLYKPLIPFFVNGPPDTSTTLIHGDFIFQNFLHLNTSSSRFGLIDWEFGGFYYKSFDYSWFLVMSTVYDLCDVSDLPTFSTCCPNEPYFLLFSYLRLLLRLSQVRHRSEVHVLQEIRFIRMLMRFLDIYDLPRLSR